MRKSPRVLGTRIENNLDLGNTIITVSGSFDVKLAASLLNDWEEPHVSSSTMSVDLKTFFSLQYIHE
jgi:hypothetical protein